MVLYTVWRPDIDSICVSSGVTSTTVPRCTPRPYLLSFPHRTSTSNTPLTTFPSFFFYFTPSPPSPHPHRTKDFKIVKLLGKGTYGAVYKVIRKSDKEEYALKEVSLKALKKREREDAVNEVRVLASIKHRNILRYCEAFLEGSNLYIVTEYAKGGDLHGKIKRYTAKRKSLAEKTVWT